MTRPPLVLLSLLVACDAPRIDGLLPAEDPDLQYIEWIAVPATGADAAFIAQVIGDSDRAPVAYIGATWCGSCNAYKATLESDTMKEVHGQVQVLELDLDRHKGLLADLGIRPAGVPHWEGLDASGKSTGVRVDGRAFSADTEAVMAPVLKDYFAKVSGGS